MICNMTRSKLRKTNITLLQLSILLHEKILESTPDNFDFTDFHTVTHLHWKARTSRRCWDSDKAKMEKI